MRLTIGFVLGVVAFWLTLGLVYEVKFRYARWKSRSLPEVEEEGA